jgi:hypothetical protein
MGRRKVVRTEETMDADKPQEISVERADTTADIYRDEAMRSKYEFFAKKNELALEELKARSVKAQSGGDEDEFDKAQRDMLRTMKAQVTMKTFMKMLEEPKEKSNGDDGVRRELSEAIRYMDSKLDAIAAGNSEKKPDYMQQMMMQQLMQAQQQNQQMMMAMLNKSGGQDPLLTQMLLKTMDQKTSMKDFLPMMAQMQTFGMQANADLEKARMGIMQEVVMHALSAGEKDWDTMSMMEKAEMVMSMLSKTGMKIVDGIKDFKTRKYERKDGATTEGGEARIEAKDKAGLGYAQPPEASKTPTVATDGSVPPAAQGDAAAVQAEPDADVKAAISERVNFILVAVEKEMRIGSSPDVVFEEIEKVYFGLPDGMRAHIESEENPMQLVQAIDGYADKVLLDKIVQGVMADKKKAEWLKGFHNAILGIGEDEDGDDDGGGGVPDDGGDDDGKADAGPEST